MPQQQHWEHVYATKAVTRVSWYQEHATESRRLMRRAGIGHDGAIIDVGGGASTLVDDLLTEGFSNLTVLDLSGAALAASRNRLGKRAPSVRWLEGDVLEVSLPHHGYDLWHDRAAFHFLTVDDDRRTYIARALDAVKPNGHVIVATFADDGPTQCSGLPVMRYSPTELQAQFGPRFTLLDLVREDHHTPFGTTQKFVYCLFQLTTPGSAGTTSPAHP